MHFLLDQGEVLVVGLNGEVVGMNPDTGDELWRNEMEEGDQGAVEIAIVDNLVLACADRGQLYALDYKTGLTMWKVATSRNSGRATILMDERRCFVAKGGVVDCFDLRGQLKWSKSIPDTGVGSAALGLKGNVRQADSEG